MGIVFKRIVVAVSLGLLLPSVGWSYGPLFSPRFQLPGEGSTNFSLMARQARKGFELEPGLTLGVLPYLAIGFRVPVEVISGNSAVRMGTIDAQWRLWNHDDMGRKLMLVAMGSMDIVSRRFESGDDRTPDGYAAGGLGFLYDKRKWIMIIDARLDRKANNLAGDQVQEGSPEENKRVPWADIAYGWRFYQSTEIAQDAMLVMHVQNRLKEDRATFVAAELVVQPRERWIVKAGYRIPVMSERDLSNERKLWACETEFRF